MNNNLVYSLFLKCLYFLISPIVLILYILEPFSGDVMIYFGAAKVTALTNGFPMTLDSVWEVKLIGHRFLYYLLNLIATPFHGWAYSIFVKLIVSIITIVILYYFSKQLSTRLQIRFEYPFIIGFLGLFAVNNYIIFSGEATSVIISMLMFAMLLDDHKWIQIASGLLVVPLLTLKGLPVLLVLIIMLSTMMLTNDYWERFKRAILSLPIVVISIFILMWYFPHFISDIFLSRVLNPAITQDILQIVFNFWYHGISMIGMAPIIVFGACSLLLLLSVVVKEQMRNIGLLLLMWGISSAYVMYIAQFFYIHYYLMVIPAIFTLCYFLKLYDHHQSVFILIVVTVIILNVTIISGGSLVMAFSEYKTADERQILVDNITENTDILSQPTTLYLDDGSLSYYFPTPSACRYVGSVPYERNSLTQNITFSKEYWENRNCTLAYTGKYILVNRNFFNFSAPPLKEISTKIKNEYAMIYTFDEKNQLDIRWWWNIYERKT